MKNISNGIADNGMSGGMFPKNICIEIRKKPADMARRSTPVADDGSPCFDCSDMMLLRRAS